MNAGGHAGQRSRVQSHIQRASEKQAHLPAICATACEMVRSSTKTVAHAATLSLTRSPAVTLCNEVLVQVCAAWTSSATTCTACGAGLQYDASKSPAFISAAGPAGLTQAVRGLITQQPIARRRRHSSSETHEWFAFASGLERWQKCIALDACFQAFTQASTWLHKYPVPFTEASRPSFKAPASCLRRIGF